MAKTRMMDAEQTMTTDTSAGGIGIAFERTVNCTQPIVDMVFKKVNIQRGRFYYDSQIYHDRLGVTGSVNAIANTGV